MSVRQTKREVPFPDGLGSERYGARIVDRRSLVLSAVCCGKYLIGAGSDGL
ncbi:MAG: hypothetical protein GY788_13205 [bacterium]|nr:hypothetical protein [bacterium]